MIVFIKDQEGKEVQIRSTEGGIIIGDCKKISDLTEELKEIITALFYAKDIPISIEGFTNIAIVNYHGVVEIHERHKGMLTMYSEKIISLFVSRDMIVDNGIESAVNKKVAECWKWKAERAFKEILLRI